MTTKECIRKRLLLMILMTAAAFVFLPFSAFADSAAFISTPESDVPLGTDFNVTVTFNADSRIGTVQAALSYSEQDISFVSSDYAYGSGGIVNINAFPPRASSNMIVTLTFHALRQGSSAITLTNGSIMSPDGTMLAGTLSDSAMITIGEPRDISQTDDSGDSLPEQPAGELQASLRSLRVSAGELKPAFSPGIYDYTVTVPHDVDYFGIDAEPAGPYDTIWFEGSEYLADGITIRTITVTSGDGTVSNVYTVTVTRLPEEESETDSEETVSSDESSDSTESTAVTTAAADSSSNKNQVSPRDPDSRRTVSEEEPETMHDKLAPAMIAAIVVILILIGLLVVHINKRSRNRPGSGTKRRNTKRKR